MRRVAFAIIAGLAAGPAFAHDDAKWIQDNAAFKRADGVHCCGTHDCERASPADFIEGRDQTGPYIEWRGKRLYHGKPDGVRGGIYWSDEPKPDGDQDWWVCAGWVWRLDVTADRKLHCIFQKFGGS